VKMNRQNPGGEVHSKPTMKGCEKFITHGQGNVLGGTLQTKYALKAPGMEGLAKGGHTFGAKHAGAHARTSFTGKNGSGYSKACK